MFEWIGNGGYAVVCALSAAVAAWIGLRWSNRREDRNSIVNQILAWADRLQKQNTDQQCQLDRNTKRTNGVVKALRVSNKKHKRCEQERLSDKAAAEIVHRELKDQLAVLEGTVTTIQQNGGSHG